MVALALFGSVSAYAEEYKVSCYASHFVMGSSGYYTSAILAKEEKAITFNDGGAELALEFNVNGDVVKLTGGALLSERKVNEDISFKTGAVTANVIIPARNIDLSLNDGLMIDLADVGIKEGVMGKSSVTIKLGSKPEDIYTLGCSLNRKR